MKRYLCYLESYTFCQVDQNTVLVVNLLDDSYIYSKDQILRELISRMMVNNNHFVYLSEDELENYKSNIEILRKYFVGDCFPLESDEGEPALFVSQLNYKDPQKSRKEILGYTDTSLKDQILKATVFTSKSSYDIFGHLYGIKESNVIAKKMSKEEFISLINLFATFHSLKIVQFYVDDEGSLELLLDSIIYSRNKIDYKIEVYVREALYIKHIKLINRISSLSIKIVVYLDMMKIKKMEFQDSSVSFLFPIYSNQDLRDFNNIADRFSGNITPIPAVNDTNEDFIKEIFYIDTAEVLSQSNKEGRISLNMILNTNFFGNVFIFPGWYFSLSFMESEKYSFRETGTSFEKAIKDASISKDNLWFKCRSEEKCSRCVFQYLCPPPTYIEIVLKGITFCGR